MSESEKIVAAVFAGLLLLLPAVTTMVMTLMNRRDSRVRGEKQAEATQAVHVLVNDKFTSALKEISSDKARIAELTGRAGDVAVAQRAAAQVESHAVEAGISAAVAAAASTKK